MSLKIKNISASIVKLGLAKPYTISYKTVTDVDCLYLEVTAENGEFGLGASNVSHYVVGETNADALADFSEDKVSKFIGKDLMGFHGVIDEMYECFTKVGARTALDIAFHDLYCKHLGVSVAEFYGQKIPKLLTSVTIGIMSLEETLAEAKAFIADGFKNLKIKLGESYEKDIARIRHLRENISADIFIRIDANRGWSKEETLQFHTDTQSLNIELVEQPMHQDVDDEMRTFPDDLKKLIAADESLVSPQDALKLIGDNPACGIFNIKIMKCAGITKAREIATIAKNAGIDLMWGCNDESLISITAALHMALACGNTKYLDLDGSFDLARAIDEGGFILEDGYPYYDRLILANYHIYSIFGHVYS